MERKYHQKVKIILTIAFFSSFIFNFHNVIAATDPDLEPGFPVQALSTPGQFQSGQVLNTLVGNIDEDPELEILVSGVAAGPLYAFNYDGSIVNGWPTSEFLGVAYTGLGQFNLNDNALEVMVANFSGTLNVHDGDGSIMPGWPQTSSNFISSPPTMLDIDKDGIDEIFIAEEDRKIHAYYADGTVVPGWPILTGSSSQSLWTPAVADLDNDGDMEIIFSNGSSTTGVSLYAYHHNGTPVTGFPIKLHSGYVMTFPVIGDVDGDGENEIVVIEMDETTPLYSQINIYSVAGKFERSMTASGSLHYASAPALADMDKDGFPEIIIQTNESIEIWKGDGTVFPGWPFIHNKPLNIRNSSPVIADVDGDQKPDVIVTYYDNNGANVGYVYVISSEGNVHHRFPKLLPLGGSAVPAVSDIDLDGRNEIIITSEFWNGHTGNYDKVWVFDLGGPRHALPEWVQFMGGAKHHGRYQKPEIQNVTETNISMEILPSVLTGKMGTEMTISYVVKNTGTIDASKVNVRGTVPKQTLRSLYVDVLSINDECSISDNMFSCDLGLLNVGQSHTITLNIIANNIGPFEFQAVAYGFEKDTDVTDNFRSVAMDFVLPDSDINLAMISNATRSTSVGDEITYTINATNLGSDRAMNLIIHNPIPENTSVISTSPSCIVYTQDIICKPGNIDVGSNKTVDIILKPTVRGTLINTATASGDYIDANNVNNSSSLSLRIKR